MIDCSGWWIYRSPSTVPQYTLNISLLSSHGVVNVCFRPNNVFSFLCFCSVNPSRDNQTILCHLSVLLPPQAHFSLSTVCGTTGARKEDPKVVRGTARHEAETRESTLDLLLGSIINRVKRLEEDNRELGDRTTSKLTASNKIPTAFRKQSKFR